MMEEAKVVVEEEAHESMPSTVFIPRDTSVEFVKEDVSNLTLRQKLARIRAEFAKNSIKKSGVNDFADFRYFELCDIVPVAVDLFLKYEVTLDFQLTDDYIVGTLHNNCDEEEIAFSFPRRHVDSLPKMNPMQVVGSEITYYRRYLYCIVLDIAENDSVDCNAPENAPKPSRNMAKAELTNTDAPATPLQVEGLKKALKALREKDSKYEDKLKIIAQKTQKFTKISKQECEDLIIEIGGLLNDNANMEGQASTTSNTDSETKEDNRD